MNVLFVLVAVAVGIAIDIASLYAARTFVYGAILNDWRMSLIILFPMFELILAFTVALDPSIGRPGASIAYAIVRLPIFFFCMFKLEEAKIKASRQD